MDIPIQCTLKDGFGVQIDENLKKINFDFKACFSNNYELYFERISIQNQPSIPLTLIWEIGKTIHVLFMWTTINGNSLN